MPKHATDESRAPLGYRLQEVSTDALAALAKDLGLAARRAKAVDLRNQLANALGDPRFLRDRLAGMPVPCLVALEALVEARGAAQGRELIGIVARRCGCRDAAAAAGLDRLLQAGWVLADARNARIARLAIPQAAGAALYSLLSGVSLPDEPPPDDAIDPAALRRVRDMVAVAALTAHRRVLLNQDRSSLNRTTLKSFGKGLGLELDALDALLQAAMNQGLLGARNERLVADARALVGAASGQPVASSWSARVRASIGETWLPVEQLTRAADAQGVELRGDDYYVSSHLNTARITQVVERLTQAPGLAVRAHGGHAWVKRLPAVTANGDGHVTPSFEVMLGPAADLGTVARVALGCELQRVDHVLTLRLTPASVTAAIAQGLSKEELSAALSAVGPHGLPPNVQTMLHDWTAAVRVAHVRRGAFLFADEALAEQIEARLANGAVEARPAPGVLELAPWLEPADLEKALAQAGACLGGTSTLEAARHARMVQHSHFSDEHAVGHSDIRSLQAGNQPDPQLRALVSAARRSGDFGPTLLEVSAEEAVEVLEQLSGAPVPAAARELFAAVSQLGKQLAPELETFRSGLAADEREMLDMALAMPVPLIPWLVLSRKARRQVLERSRSLQDLLERSADLASSMDRRSPDGNRIWGLVRTPGVQQALIALDSDRGMADDEPDMGERAALVARDFDFDSDDLDDTFEPASDAEAYGISESERRAILSRRPPPGKLNATPRELTYLLAKTAAEAQHVVHIDTRIGGRSVVHSAVAEVVKKRGGQQVLLAFDLESLEPRAFPLDSVRALSLE